MTDTLYPYGYGSRTAPLETLERRYGGPMLPEYRRRLFAWLRAQDGRVGIGSAWRPTPSDTSAASRAGHSFHQDQTFRDGQRGICAVDLVVVRPGHVHRAPTWDEVPRQGSDDARTWGVHANVHGEPWHLQPVELDGWSSWARAGRPSPVPGYGIPELAPTPGGAPPAFDPLHGAFSLWPIAEKPEISVGARGDVVRYLQGVIRLEAGHGRLAVDGRYGHQTAGAVEDVQRYFQLHVDGITGPQTWRTIDQLAAQA